MTKSDCIAGIASAAGGAIGIIRISGDDAVSIAQSVFQRKRKSKLIDRKFYYGHVTDEGGIIDEAMLVTMRAPKTYTRENVAEIHCHGGGASLRRCFDAVVAAGARVAEPGEFTKRAFLNGRLDLARAEAVMDVISASGEASLKLAERALEGNISGAVRRIYTAVSEEIAAIETFLDSPEHSFGVIEGDLPGLSERLSDISKELTKIRDSYDYGRVIKEGISTVITGKPNVGKSSILNALYGAERAIVTDIPGTTRDVLTETIYVGRSGLQLRLADTAGIRTETSDPVEIIGSEKAVKEVARADLILFVVDGSAPLTDEDIFVHRKVRKERKKGHLVYVVNKKDISMDESVIPALRELDEESRIVHISAKTGEGLSLFTSSIEEIFQSGTKEFEDDSVIITNSRHAELLSDALLSFNSAIRSLERGFTEDVAASELMDSCAFLGRILGLDVSEDIINTIFSKFCIGK